MMILIVKACFLTGYRDDITEAITKDAGCDSAHAGVSIVAIRTSHGNHRTRNTIILLVSPKSELRF